MELTVWEKYEQLLVFLFWEYREIMLSLSNQILFVQQPLLTKK